MHEDPSDVPSWTVPSSGMHAHVRVTAREVDRGVRFVSDGVMMIIQFGLIIFDFFFFFNSLSCVPSSAPLLLSVMTDLLTVSFIVTPLFPVRTLHSIDMREPSSLSIHE